MISKAKIRYIRSLELKKNRMAERLFVAEGPKVVEELLGVLSPKILLATDSWAPVNTAFNSSGLISITDDELCKVSFLKTPQQVLGVFPMFSIDKAPVAENITAELSLALDGVQDPGNLGTIIRVADWFGIRRIFCSHDTADVYNPKVVQATMGSLARVNVVYMELETLLNELPKNFPVYGTLLNGESIYCQQLSAAGIIVMGNEGNGISAPIRKKITRRLLVPNFPEGKTSAESLNVAVATAVVCAEFRRQQL
ncbi:RNA methyltransferase [Hoylesella saccharolytica]|uniref:RNA methyltransferase n=1 Tax=Hoylesella saccharolytica TaxID=633701 RepID=UPI0028F00360|nr:RNA methyltransferase [Hoylesella saccharolytica]